MSCVVPGKENGEYVGTPLIRQHWNLYYFNQSISLFFVQIFTGTDCIDAIFCLHSDLLRLQYIVFIVYFIMLQEFKSKVSDFLSSDQIIQNDAIFLLLILTVCLSYLL